MKINKIYLIISYLFLSLYTYSQPVIIKTDTVIAAGGDSITVPVKISNLNNVGSITLYIQYSPGAISWGKGKNWLPQFNNGFNFANAANGVIAITCVNYTGVTLTQGKLLDLTFKYNSYTTPLTFLPSCEVTDLNGNPVTPAVVYHNGIVVPSLLINPSASKSICYGSSTTISSTPTGLFGTYSYQWSSNPPGFTSTISNPTVSPLVTTTYTVTVSSSGHSDTASIAVSVINPGPPSAVSSMLPPNGIIDVDNPVTLSWAPATGTTSYDVYYWKSTELPSTPMNTSQISLLIPGDLTQGKTYLWKIVSKNQCFQTEGPESQFTMRSFPDLHVTQVTNSTALAGQPFEVSWVVKNDGAGPTNTPLWYDRVWISPDIEVRVGEPEHKLLGTFPNVSALAPGESYTQTQQFILPPNLIGTYYIFVITDALDALFFTWPYGVPQVPYNPPPYAFGWTHGGSMVNVVKEASDAGQMSDNFFYKEVTLAVPPLPDLIVTDVQKPSTIFSGQPLSLNWTVKNQGQANTLTTAWSDKVYLSNDSVLNTTTAFNLGTFNHTGILKIDSTYTRSAVVNIPNYVSGPYFIYVVTDVNNQVFEYIYESNNTTRSDTLQIFLTPPPDLVVTNVLIPASGSDKDYASVKFTVINQGATATTAGYWHDGIYLSTHPVFNPATSLLMVDYTHSGNLNSFDQYSLEIAMPIPANITGPYYIYVKTDILNGVFEYSDSNNVTRSDTTINILSPDLYASSISMPLADSMAQADNISWYDKNLGPGKLIGQNWQDKIYLCPNAIFDSTALTLTDSVTMNAGIASGDSVLIARSVILPNVPDGDYYLFVNTDRKNQVFENTGESNNIGRSAATIHILHPDLVVNALQYPVSVQSGLPFSFSAILKNIGPGTLAGKNITNKFYLSASPVFNPATSLLLGTVMHLSTLHPQDTAVVHATLNVPDGIIGPFYLVCTTDFTNVVKEGSHENNNTTVSTTALTVTPGPFADLSPISVIVPDSTSAGSVIQISYTVKNIGGKLAPNVSWKDKIYRSSSPVWDSTITTLLKTITHVGSLKPDSSYTTIFGLTLPSNMAAGHYYLFVFTDAMDNVFESTGESNNISDPASIYIKPYPIDLKVTDAVTPVVAVDAGQLITMNYSVQNISSVAANAGYWYDALYLSTDSILNTSTDIYVGRWQVSGPVQPGLQLSFIKSINIPNGISGDYYLILRSDLYNDNHDINLVNNARVLRNTGSGAVIIHITLLPAPDLIVQTLTSSSQVFSGQAFTVHFTVKNNGVGIASGPWIDKLYLSSDFEINNGDVLIGTHTFSGALNPGESYTDSITTTQNVAASGNYVLIMKCDADNAVFEGDGESNNTQTSFIIISIPPPGDLIVTDITSALTAVAGDPVTVSWKVRNIGTYSLSGQLKDAIYFSKDSVFSSSLPVWNTYINAATIPSNGDVDRSFTSTAPGLIPGNYYVFVKTDITNVFPETSETNNVGRSLQTVNFDYREIPIGIKIYDTLPNSSNLYYKLVIPPDQVGETFVLIMKADSMNGVNQLFASFNKVPSLISHDFMYKFPYKGNQELIIPVTKAGTYYFLATGNTSSGNHQNISLLGNILQFSIRNLDRNTGGNTGSVTVLVNGSKFSPGMKISLYNDSVEISASEVIYVDPSQVMARFLLSTVAPLENPYEQPQEYGAHPGFYNVRAKKLTGEQCILLNGFQVIEGGAPQFLTNIQYPPQVRQNRYFTMSIEFANTGNVDIAIPVRTLMSMAGAPIGFGTDALKLNFHDLKLIFQEPGGPQYVLRPGAVSEIKIYCKSSHPCVFKLLK